MAAHAGVNRFPAQACGCARELKVKRLRRRLTESSRDPHGIPMARAGVLGVAERARSPGYERARIRGRISRQLLCTNTIGLIPKVQQKRESGEGGHPGTQRDNPNPGRLRLTRRRPWPHSREWKEKKDTRRPPINRPATNPPATTPTRKGGRLSFWGCHQLNNFE
jgi:hypothetical protein